MNIISSSWYKRNTVGAKTKKLAFCLKFAFAA